MADREWLADLNLRAQLLKWTTCGSARFTHPRRGQHTLHECISTVSLAIASDLQRLPRHSSYRPASASVSRFPTARSLARHPRGPVSGAAIVLAPLRTCACLGALHPAISMQPPRPWTKACSWKQSCASWYCARSVAGWAETDAAQQAAAALAWLAWTACAVNMI